MLVGRYSALLDTNVLHPAFLRGALLWFADERLLRPVWSKDILAEWRRSVLRRHKDLDEDKLLELQSIFTRQFPDAEVTNYQSFIDGLELHDPNDRHVLAAAIVGRCNGIVTANLKDFPQATLDKYGLEAVHPDTFIVNIIDLDQDKALGACRRHRQAMTKSKPTVEQFLERYEAAGLIQAHQRLSKHKELL
ncbi:PIN domain-containing protein [Erythrobacter sp. F6033]|uniref:PIN domain-containing protein n=1 Tax=Erythrobacter sp. F6033 TaxID=2926401 RepID=UPI001FF6B4DD|nr:PIN domain-containing protein [Erythrobacter sp. F6033]MCK0129274.1 PIN domain-containing protein [Erythrobacter sp. F6033]